MLFRVPVRLPEGEVTGVTTMYTSTNPAAKIGFSIPQNACSVCPHWCSAFVVPSSNQLDGEFLVGWKGNVFVIQFIDALNTFFDVLAKIID